MRDPIEFRIKAQAQRGRECAERHEDENHGTNHAVQIRQCQSKFPQYGVRLEMY